MNKKTAISVIGLGKLGLCTAACFADKGFKVIGVDIDINKVNQINKGLSPIQETGLAGLIRRTGNNLIATTNYADAISGSSVTFIVVATPSLADGSFSNEYLEKTLHLIGRALQKKKAYHLVVVTSTVMPQTIDTVVKFILEKTSGKICGRDFGVAYNPEFIALGSVIHDFLNPDMILIGEMNKKDGDLLENIYAQTCENNPRFARMSPVNAEIAKISLNCYITTKITFANSLASICDKIKDSDAHIIAQALGMDSRIGSKYIRPGLGYGGPCFPRDNIAFATFARIFGVNAKLAKMVDEVNCEQVFRIEGKIKHMLECSRLNKEKARIGILGLSYKPNTPIIEDSQALNIAQLLVKEGYNVEVYDPQAMENAKGVLGGAVSYAQSADACVRGADLLVLAVPWPEFKEINFVKLNKNAVVLDCWKCVEDPKGLKIEFLGKG